MMHELENFITKHGLAIEALNRCSTAGHLSIQDRAVAVNAIVNEVQALLRRLLRTTPPRELAPHLMGTRFEKAYLRCLKERSK